MVTVPVNVGLAVGAAPISEGTSASLPPVACEDLCAVGVRASVRRLSDVTTAVPVTDAALIPPDAIFAEVTVPSVGVRVSDNRESFPAAASVAPVPSALTLAVPAA